MALTRINVEKVSIGRLGSLLTEAGLDGVTVDGSNPDLNYPIGFALRKLGHSVADIDAVADADIAPVVADDYDELFDWTEFRTLSNILVHLNQTDLSVEMYSESFNQLPDRVQKLLDMKRSWIDEEYGVSGWESGTISVDFMQKD